MITLKSIPKKYASLFNKTTKTKDQIMTILNEINLLYIRDGVAIFNTENAKSLQKEFIKIFKFELDENNGRLKPDDKITRVFLSRLTTILDTLNNSANIKEIMILNELTINFTSYCLSYIINPVEIFQLDICKCSREHIRNYEFNLNIYFDNDILLMIKNYFDLSKLNIKANRFELTDRAIKKISLTDWNLIFNNSLIVNTINNFKSLNINYVVLFLFVSFHSFKQTDEVKSLFKDLLEKNLDHIDLKTHKIIKNLLIGNVSVLSELSMFYSPILDKFGLRDYLIGTISKPILEL